MAISDELKRWTKDRFSRDENITVTPAKALKSVDEILSELSSTERRRNIEHLKAYADLYYQGRHNMDLPKDVRDNITQLEKRAERLNVVDIAKDLVTKYGGPPSRQTIAESLERSAQERGRDISPVATSNKTPGRAGAAPDLPSVAAATLNTVEPKIEKEWAQALRKDPSQTVNARFEANLEGLNALRKDLLQRHPDWETKLPPAVNVQEVSRRISEQVREQKLGQQLSR